MVRYLVIPAVSLAILASATATQADHGPVIVIPSRPGIPVVIHGRDASFAVVEGDWGLHRPGHGEVTVLGGAPVRPSWFYTQRNPYHPRYGVPPGRGRYEIEPPPGRSLPEPAETFSRFWSTNAPSLPVFDAPNGDDVSPTIVDPQTFTQPPVVVTPPRGRRP
jgi:hypothetical protein